MKTKLKHVGIVAAIILTIFISIFAFMFLMGTSAFAILLWSTQPFIYFPLFLRISIILGAIVAAFFSLEDVGKETYREAWNAKDLKSLWKEFTK